MAGMRCSEHRTSCLGITATTVTSAVGDKCIFGEVEAGNLEL